jgi:hypothetical protein
VSRSCRDIVEENHTTLLIFAPEKIAVLFKEPQSIKRQIEGVNKVSLEILN